MGEISDEYDEDNRNYHRIDDTTWIFEAKTQLNDFYKITGLDEELFDDYAENCESLAGLILEIKGDFPTYKESIDYNGFRFTILQMDKRSIKKVKFQIINLALVPKED